MNDLENKIIETNKTDKKKITRLGLPVVSLGAEFLVMGHLMRRNILTYKAPPNNEGYDLICIHPDSKKNSNQIRVQVKSRYATDCNRGVPIKKKSLDSFNYLVISFLNIGNYFSKNKQGKEASDGRIAPDFYTFPVDLIRKCHSKKEKDWEKVFLKDLKDDNNPNFHIDDYKNEKGFDLIAKELKIDYPTKELASPDNKL